MGLVLSGRFTIVLERVNRDPVWLAPQTLRAQSGVPSSFDIGTLVSDPDGDPLRIALVDMSPELAAVGLVFDAETRQLRFDGRVLAESVTGVVQFSADDGVKSANGA